MKLNYSSDAYRVPNLIPISDHQQCWKGMSKVPASGRGRVLLVIAGL